MKTVDLRELPGGPPIVDRRTGGRLHAAGVLRCMQAAGDPGEDLEYVSRTPGSSSSTCGRSRLPTNAFNHRMRPHLEAMGLGMPDRLEHLLVDKLGWD
jgi:hypothetical protein